MSCKTFITNIVYNLNKKKSESTEWDNWVLEYPDRGVMWLESWMIGLPQWDKGR